MTGMSAATGDGGTLPSVQVAAAAAPNTAETIWEAALVGDTATLRGLIRHGFSVNRENPVRGLPCPASPGCRVGR